MVNMKVQGGGAESEDDLEVDDDEDEDEEEDGREKFPADMGGYEGCLSFRKAEYGNQKEKEGEGSRASSIIVKDYFEGQDEITNKEKATEMLEIINDDSGQVVPPIVVGNNKFHFENKGGPDNNSSINIGPGIFVRNNINRPKAGEKNET
ncbi:hypothetical protein Tco_1159471 [Tanacetum coccineum]